MNILTFQVTFAGRVDRLPINARCQEAPIFSPFSRHYMMIDQFSVLQAGHLDPGPGHRLPVGGDDPPHPGHGGLHEGEESLLVVIKLHLQLLHRRLLAAGQFKSDLHAVGEVVVEILNKHFEPVLVCCGFFFKTQKHVSC